MTRRRQKPLFEEIAEPFADIPATVGFGVAGALGVFGWGLTWYHGTSLAGLLLATMLPWFVWLLAFTIVAYSAAGSIRRRFDRKRFDSTIDLRHLDPYQFERYVAEYYRRRGWLVTNRGGRGPDGGVDVVIESKAEKLLVQCKHWKAWRVGIHPVRELAGLIRAERATGAIVVTSGTFTREARDFAGRNDIRVVDGDALRQMVVEVRNTPAAAPTVRASSVRRCPSCGSDLVRRTSTRGAHAGEPFWGCSTFPACRYIEPIPARTA